MFFIRSAHTPAHTPLPTFVFNCFLLFQSFPFLHSLFFHRMNDYMHDRLLLFFISLPLSFSLILSLFSLFSLSLSLDCAHMPSFFILFRCTYFTSTSFSLLFTLFSFCSSCSLPMTHFLNFALEGISLYFSSPSSFSSSLSFSLFPSRHRRRPTVGWSSKSQAHISGLNPTPIIF
jgi:hypothetical protein